VPDSIAVDGREYVVARSDERVATIVSWHAPPVAPSGLPFGATGVCVTSDRRIILVSRDGELWGLPGGRPEGDESPEETLRREILEEACANVTEAQLLGFCRISDIGGPGAGIVKVRSVFLAAVEVQDWRPCFETRHRRLVDMTSVRSQLTFDAGPAPIYSRMLREARIE
jgi:ADP-ribose pyrophosphatase YjhB (NUDIX family)